MVEIRIHGRGGQGVVTASDLVAMAAFKEGHHAQAFPSFGSERTGAPVVSYCRVEDEVIRSREPVLEPDIIIVQDPTLLAVMDVFAGEGRAVTVPASEIAREKLGRPLPNAALLGAMAAMTGLVDITSVEEAIKTRFHGRVGDSNAAAARAAYDFVKESADAETD